MNLPPLPPMQGLSLEQKFSLTRTENALHNVDKQEIIKLFMQMYKTSLLKETYYSDVIRSLMSIDNMENND